MLISNPDLINSCRVCRSPNQDGDYECLYQTPVTHEDRPMLTEAGILYENLLDISLNKGDYYPQFLCNSCDLQMKLFKKLKDKAYKTLEYLQNLYEDQVGIAKEETDEQENVPTQLANEQDTVETLEEYECLENREIENETNEYQETATNECHDYQDSTAEEYQETETNEYQESINNEYQSNATDEYLDEKLTVISGSSEEHIKQECLYTEEDLPHTAVTAVDDCKEETPISMASLKTSQFKVQIKPIITDLKYRFSTEEITENTQNSNENIPQIRLDLEPVIDKSDYVTEIYEMLDDEIKVENYAENNDNIIQYDIYTEKNTESRSSMVFSDIEYVIEEEMCDKPEVKKSKTQKKRGGPAANASKRRKVEGTAKKKEYKCEACQLEFQTIEEEKLHRTEVHNEKYPCSVCSKELKTLPALHQHMKLHNDQPAFQCEICRKTFNQKGHYQYHMNRHNNVRNFPCSECEKAFISKTDLKVHMRSHTGQRPYVCSTCGKDYLMMEHLKAHLLVHTEQYFQCDICQHKFSTHKTLRMHVRTIHEDEPKFKCSFCSKPFRRKHHLEYHLKLHQKNVTFLDSRYEMVDDPDGSVNAEAGYNSDDIVDQELVDDPGFIAL